MKTLIVYASNTGTTKKCAEMLEKLIPDTDIVDIEKSIPDPNGYDNILIGTPIRMGAIDKKISEYVENTKPILLKKETGVFICCGDVSKANGYIVENFPDEIIMHSKRCMTFGGEFDISNAHGLDKLMLKLMKKASKELENAKIDENAIKGFAGYFGGK